MASVQPFRKLAIKMIRKTTVTFQKFLFIVSHNCIHRGIESLATLDREEVKHIEDLYDLEVLNDLEDFNN